jgi:hypothetical protein
MLPLRLKESKNSNTLIDINNTTMSGQEILSGSILFLFEMVFKNCVGKYCQLKYKYVVSISSNFLILDLSI